MFDDEKMKLADRYLGDDGYVDILLGMDCAHILPVHSCAFGYSDALSLCFFTVAGFTVAGDMSNLLRNASHFHMLRSFSDTINSIE